VVLRVAEGDAVRRGDVVAELHADDPGRLPAGREAMAGAVRVGAGPARRAPLIIGRVERA
jgi:thymidine phosphorylase